jgi:hypothetical protein
MIRRQGNRHDRSAAAFARGVVLPAAPELGGTGVHARPRRGDAAARHLHPLPDPHRRHSHRRPGDGLPVRDTAPEWLRSHYTFQIRTIWIGLLYCIVAGLLCFVLVGFLLFPVVAIWFIVRCALGLVRLSQREPYPNPYSWTI